MDYKQNLLRLSERLGVPANYLDAVIEIESRRNPQARNKDTGATGIIQFMPSTARELGTTVEEIYNMSLDEQFELTYRYFITHSKGKQLNRPCDVYLVIFYPKYIGYSLDTVFPNSVYQVNKGLDYNKNGVLTVGDINDFFNSRIGYEYADLPAVSDEIIYKVEEKIEQHPYIFLFFVVGFLVIILKKYKVI